jgi:hypothetical protein
MAELFWDQVELHTCTQNGNHEHYTRTKNKITRFKAKETISIEKQSCLASLVFWYSSCVINNLDYHISTC